MPSIPDEFVPIRTTSPTPDVKTEDADFMDTLGAAGTIANWPYRAWRYQQNRAGLVAEDDHDPFALIKGTKYESDPGRFAYSRSEQETRAIMAEWDADETATDTLSRSGWTGTVASVGMGLLDPTIFLPVVGVFGGVARGARAARIAADTALSGAAGAAIGEAAMAATTPNYTAGDVALGIGTATVLSGLIGGAAGALLSRAERKALEGTLHADREAWGRDLTPGPASAGAAAADTRVLEMNTPGMLKALPDVTAKVSPPRRVLNGSFTSARRATVDLVETPYIFRENLDGVATTQGPALDRLMKLETARARIAVSNSLDDLWTRYRFGDGGAGWAQKKMTAASDMLGRDTGGKLTYPQFKEAIADAMRNGDESAVPEVAEAAKVLRKTVFEPWRDRAIKAGLLPDDVEAKTADSYLMRVWDKQKLIARRPEVTRVFSDWLAAEQDKKLRARDRISGLVDLKEGYAAKIDELEAQLTARVDRLAQTEARQAEVSSFGKAAYQRAGALRERLDGLTAQQAANAERRSDVTALLGDQEEHLAELRAIEAEIDTLVTELTKVDAGRAALSTVSKQAFERATALREKTDAVGRDTAAGRKNLAKAQGGAVFETAARNAQNRLADAASGVRARLDAVTETFREMSQVQSELLAGLRQDLADLPGSSALRGSASIREQLAALEAREIAARKAFEERAAEGAVFETRVRNRQNLLADRISGLDAEVDDLKTRIADMTARHDRLQGDIEKEILGWEGRSSRDAKAALKARTKAEQERQARMDAGTYGGAGGRLTSADTAVNAAVRRILTRGPERSRQEIESLAGEIIDRIVSGPDGRLPYDAPSGGPRGGVPAGNADARGPLASRTFMIPDNLVRDYLENDVEEIAKLYTHTMSADVLLTERFGDVDMTEAFRRLNEEASARELAATTEAERLKIRAEKNSIEADLAGMRDRIRGTYGYSSDPRNRFIGRVAATVARANIMADLGGTTLASLGDLAGLQWRYGMATTFRDAWRPLLKSIVDPALRAELKKYRSQVQAFGIAAETYLASRAAGVYDVLDVYKPTSRFERAVNVMSDKFGLVNMLTPWTDFGKFAAAMVSGAELTKAAEALAAGTATARQIRDLAENGIDGAMAQRIAAALAADGGANVVDGLKLPNPGSWTDEGARLAFEGAMARDTDIMIISPGAEKPLMMSKPVAALILQYKSFVVAANERLLVRSLQARDAQVLQGLASAIALGALSGLAYQVVANTDDDKRMKSPADILKEGIQRSGVLGWYAEGNSILAKWTGGAADGFRLIGAGKPDARYISRSPGGALLGPTFGKAETTVKSMSVLVSKALGGDAEWKESDTRNLRRLIAGQNLFYIRRLLDAGEEEVNEMLGVEPK